MPATPPDDDRHTPAPHAAKHRRADAGKSIRTKILSPHRQLVAALLAASALVPLSQPAEAREQPVSEQGNVALKAFVAQPEGPKSLPPAGPYAEVAELNKMKRAVVAEEQREKREAAAERRAAKARAKAKAEAKAEARREAKRAAEAKAEARREAKREAAERARERAAAQPDYVRPTEGTLTSGFGNRSGSAHTGIDIANSIGTPIVSVADGTVIEAGPASGFGLWVRVRHDDGTVTVYGHVNEITASTGQRVSAGEQIATVGNRGYSTGPHLHFEVWTGGSTKVDPMGWLTARGVSV